MSKTTSRYLPFLPMSWLLKFPIPTYKWIKYVKCPIHILHGTKDKLIPFSSSIKLATINSYLSCLHPIIGGGHNNLHNFESYHKTLSEIFKMDNLDFNKELSSISFTRKKVKCQEFKNCFMYILRVGLYDNCFNTIIGLLGFKIVFQPNFQYKNELNIPVYYSERIDTFLKIENDSLHIITYLVPKPRGVILYSHGNRSDLKRWGPIASEFTKFGYNVVCWDFRSYGKSSGIPTEKNILSDGQHVFKYVNHRYGNLPK